MAWWLVGCGVAPDPPTAVSPTPRVGAGSKGQTGTDVLTVRPSPDSVAAVPEVVEPAPPERIDAGSELTPPPVAVAAQVYSACRETRILGCDALYVRMLAAEPGLCVQLAMDNCSGNDQQALSVILPLSWRMSSGSVGTDLACDLREYDPKSQPVLSATGTIRWATRVRQISNLDIDVQLRVDPPAASDLPAQIALKTPAPLATVDACED